MMDTAGRSASGFRRAQTWKILVAYLLALFPALVLIIAAFFKAGDPALFAEQITAHQITPASWSPFLAYLFVAAELGLAAALLAFVWPRVVFGLTLFLMLFFIAITAWAWAHGHAGGCGCFGRLIDRGPRAVIIEDTVIVATSVLGMLLTQGFRTRARQWAVFAVLLVPVIVLTGFGSTLPIDGVVVGIRSGKDLSNIGLEGSAPPIEEGRVLLVLVGPDCATCETGVAALRQIAAADAAPQVLAVHVGTPGAAQLWRLKHLPSFPVVSASEKAMRQYYRRLPVTFLLENGIVHRVWWNRIPSTGELVHA